MPRVPTPPIPWGQHVRQYSSMELYHEPPPEPAQELQDSNMSCPSPFPVISQPPNYPEPPPSPRYIITEPFTPYQHTSPPKCYHNTHKLLHMERPSQPWREHLAYCHLRSISTAYYLAALHPLHNARASQMEAMPPQTYHPQWSIHTAPRQVRRHHLRLKRHSCRAPQDPQSSLPYHLPDMAAY